MIFDFCVHSNVRNSKFIYFQKSVKIPPTAESKNKMNGKPIMDDLGQ